MSEMKAAVEKLVEKELESANQRFPMFRSDHEGAAVIFEEIEEADEKLQEVKNGFSGLWNQVKSNCKDSSNYDAKWICKDAINLSCEAIQVAAMAQKFIDSQKEREKSEGN